MKLIKRQNIQIKPAVKLIACLLQILAITCLSSAYEVHEKSPAALIQAAKKATIDFVSPGKREQKKITNVTRKLLDTLAGDFSRLDEVDKMASELGFQVMLLKHEAESYVVLCEKGVLSGNERKEHKGAGVYIFRRFKEEAKKQEQSINIIQAPHTRYERYTGYISRLIFEKTEAFALFINTSHRYSEKKDDKYESDLAHNENSYFHVITRAICNRFNSVLVIQFHGYSREKHIDLGTKISVVLSNGSGPPYGKHFLRVAWRLMRFLGNKAIGTFGVDVHELGATSNVQARYINKHSNDNFIHLEMSEEFRQKLFRHERLRDGFINCFR